MIGSWRARIGNHTALFLILSLAVQPFCFMTANFLGHQPSLAACHSRRFNKGRVTLAGRSVGMSQRWERPQSGQVTINL